MVKPSDIFKKDFAICKDTSAQTVKEIMKETGLGENTVRRHAQKMVDLGKWKRVVKKESHHFVSAYLVIR